MLSRKTLHSLFWRALCAATQEMNKGAHKVIRDKKNPMKDTKTSAQGKDEAAYWLWRGRKVRTEVETDMKMGVWGSPTNQKKNISHGLYKGTEVSREVKRASERPEGII